MRYHLALGGTRFIEARARQSGGRHARLQLARALALAGDTVKAKGVYLLRHAA